MASSIRPVIRKRVVELRVDGSDYPAIAETLNKEFRSDTGIRFSGESVRKLYDRWAKRLNEFEDDGEPQQVIPPQDRIATPSIPRPVEIDDEDGPINLHGADAYRQWLGTSWSASEMLPVRHTPEHRKVVAIGDLHGRPAQWIARRIIEEDPDYIIIGGDLFDARQASPHAETPGDDGPSTLTMKEEAANIRGFLELLLSKTRATLIIFWGNHDGWVRKSLKNAGLEWLMDFYGDPIELVTQGLVGERLVLNSEELYFHMPASTDPDLKEATQKMFAKTRFLLPFGDAILSHVNFTAKHSGIATVRLAEWIYEWHRPLGLPEPSLLVQFHVHRSSVQTKQGGWLKLVEPGMAGEPVVESYKMGYQGTWIPGVIDGCVFEQELRLEGWQTRQTSVRLLSTHE